MADEWLSLSEAAALLGVHPNTVRNWTNRGLLPVHRTHGGHRRFRRSELELWMRARQGGVRGGPEALIHKALQHIRLKIGAHDLENEAWYRKLNVEARARYGQSGRALLQGLRNYLAADDQSAVAEAQALGFEYASLGRRYGLCHSEAVQAYLFFRSSLLDAFLQVFGESYIQSPHAWGAMLHKVMAFTDQILLSLVERYEKYGIPSTPDQPL